MVQFKLEAGILPKDFDADLVENVEDTSIEETRLVVIVYLRFSFLTMMIWCTFIPENAKSVQLDLLIMGRLAGSSAPCKAC
jgi:hypothetical protein